MIEKYKKEIDVDELAGEVRLFHHGTHRDTPSLDVNGIWGGYTGEGAKPSCHQRLMPKFQCALFPIRNQKR
jgi:hypothetical protein